MQAITRKLNLKEREEKTIKNLVVVFTKDLYESVKTNRSLFKRISKDVIWEMFSSNYPKFLVAVNKKVQNSLRYGNMDTINPLNVRLGSEDK